jgi:hypothetical protein
MKKLYLFLWLVSVPALLAGQTAVSGVSSPASDPSSKTRIYSLSGARNGANFFPEVEYKGVQYQAGDILSFNKFHSAEVIYSWLRKWAGMYPEIIELYEVGKSFEGRPILQLTLTNKKTGKDTDKPAAFFEGGRHSGEVTGSESVLWFIKYLLDNYGKDSLVTHLIDTKALYLKPINNPDGHSLYLHTAQSNRSTVRPYDNDRDGLTDEDPPEDLDSNGVILTMRWKDEKKGNWIPDPRDPSGRIMKRVQAGKGIYLTATEGIDNDGDGKINEDGIGGLDLHRNYPENWRPDAELTERGYTQGGSGEYPLSETETRAVVLFLLTHPNIYIVNSMDTSVPMHLRPPSTSPSDERMYPEDLEWYRYFDKTGKEITGYEKAGDVYNDYGNGTPLFGHGPDFGYWYYGAIWYGDEIWNGAKNKDYDGDGKIDETDMLKWDDEENGGDGFFEWKSIKHPVYGVVETGGFDPKFFLQNPPARHLEPWIRKEAMFNLEMVKHLPELAWDNIEVKKSKSYKSDSADFQVKVSFRNNGKLPTALHQAHLVKIVRDDRIVLDFDTAGVAPGKILFREIPDKKEQNPKRSAAVNTAGDERNIRQSSVSRNVPDTKGGSVTTAVFNIRIYDNSGLQGKATVLSTRGGILKDKEFIIR